MKMILQIFFLVCCINYSSSSRIERQTPWFAFVNCFEGESGVWCETPKTVVTPYAHNSPIFHNPPPQIHQPLPPSQTFFAQNQQPPTDVASATNPDKSMACGAEQFACQSPNQCISNKQLCDGQVNCIDASDETNCTCISRLNPNKICDNYHDCPDGSDEIGCFGCKNGMYSCYYNENEYIANSRRLKCYSDIDKCVEIMHCYNGEDESDCLLLTPKKSSSPDPFTRSTDGFLFLNLRNRWYANPACKDLSNWSREVCEHEIGVQIRDESISTVYEPFIYDGKYISGVKSKNKIVKYLVEECSVDGIESANAILRVKCPDVCGARIDFETEKPNQGMRIAGGKEAAPGSHPWLILTAAHCLNRTKYQVTHHDYLEVRAGVLRQASFSPQEQAIRVLRAVIHAGYEMESYKSDIPLLELNEPLLYNRCVQPICLPTQKRVSNETDENWMWKPENTTCLTAGWGGFTDRGPFPIENILEVELPIVRDCDPNNMAVFCAGHPAGGFDTCIGDSGGSFACRSNTSQMDFYLAGITSSGYSPEKKKQNRIHCGEPNTFTTFTRMSFFTTEIDAMKLDTTNEIFFREKRLGVPCRSNNRCVCALNGIVDCLEGEDETY